MRTEKNRLGSIEPMLAVAVTKLPEGAAWSYELKFDGYRAIGVKASGQVRLFSRNG
jgi:bifunctional non-homologous end joining protein LigD